MEPQAFENSSDDFFNKLTNFVSKNTSQIALVLSIVAIVLSLFNAYEIKHRPVVAGDPNAAVYESAEKILKELPENVPFLGNPDAKVVVIEFGDYQCPFCGRFFKETFPTLKNKYIDTGKVKFVYMDFAFLGQESNDASEAAKCAAEQNKFWEYHDMLFSNQKGENEGAFNPIALRGLASKVGLDLAVFDSCVADTRYDKAIQDESALGRKYGVNGTPNFLIGKQLIKGASSVVQFEQVIESQL